MIRSMYLSDLSDPTTKGILLTIERVLKISLAILFFGHALVQADQKDFLRSSFFGFSTINLIYCCTGMVAATLFDYIKEDINLLYASVYLNWIIIVLQNLGFAYIFYALGKKSWSTNIY